MLKPPPPMAKIVGSGGKDAPADGGPGGPGIAIADVVPFDALLATGVDDCPDRCRAHDSTVPTCRAMIPPAVRTHRMSRRPTPDMTPASARGSRKRLTELGR